MVGGYIFVDFKGMNINSGASPAEHVSGIYSRCRKAMGTGKPVFFKNLKKDTTVSGATAEITPVCAALALGESQAINASIPAFGTDYAVRFTITTGDYVYISIIAPEESEDSGENS